jgi:DNA-binding transcriptional LysR family regulator
VAPHHPLANAPEPLSDEAVRGHRAVAVADTISRGRGVTVGLLGGQDVFTVATMQDKLDAQLRGLGCGQLPECMAGPHIDTGRLVVKTTQHPPRSVRVNYAWRTAGAKQGRALQWWLKQLDSSTTRNALLERHRGV